MGSGLGTVCSCSIRGLFFIGFGFSRIYVCISWIRRAVCVGIVRNVWGVLLCGEDGRSGRVRYLCRYGCESFLCFWD